MKEKPFGYLASPYGTGRTDVHRQEGVDAYTRQKRFAQVCAASAVLLGEGYSFYCPIAHTHPIAEYGGLDPVDHDLWLGFDTPMMDAADELWILTLDGWEDSYGVRYEIGKFKAAGKPIRLVTCRDGESKWEILP